MPPLLLVLAAALLACAPGASAQAPAPPAPCNGAVQITDADDVAAADKDILRVFFGFDGGKATANVVLETAPPALGSSATSAFWRVLYDTGGARRWVGVRLSRALPFTVTTTTYEFGTHAGTLEDDSGFTTTAETTGRTFDGPEGVVQIDIPVEAGGAEGTTLARPVAVVREGNAFSDGWVEYAPGGTDAATDTGSGADYTVGPCLPPGAPDTGGDGEGVRDQAQSPPAPAPPPAPTLAGAAPDPRAAGAVIITSGSRRIKRGADYLVEGRVEPPRPSVPLEVAGVGAKGKVVALASALTGSDGTFSTSLKVPSTMAVLARVEKTFSKPVLVFLIPSVSLKTRVKRRFSKTFTATFTGRTRPALDGRVTIQRRSGSRWVTVRRAVVRRGRFAVTKARLKPARYRARVVETGVPGVQASSSSRRLR